MFIVKDWRVLGTRTDLVKHIVQITSINEEILLHQRDPSKISIATRMPWASLRETTRIEDEAYCILGIFGMSMPTIYGEGRAAFYRLQEEIMKHSSDQTIFAWTPSRSLVSVLKDVVDLTDPLHIHRYSNEPGPLLARSPSMFAGAKNTWAIPITTAILDVENILTTLRSSCLL